MSKRWILFGIVGVLGLVTGAGLLHRAGSQTQSEDPGAAKEHALATAERLLRTAGVPIPADHVTLAAECPSRIPGVARRIG